MDSSSPATKITLQFNKRKEGESGSSKRKRVDRPKKHRSAEFSRSSRTGVVTQLDSLGVRELINDPHAQVVMRPLGNTVETFSSQQTVYLETAVEEDSMARLQRRLDMLERQMEDEKVQMKRQMNNEKMEMKSEIQRLEIELKRRIDVSDLFLHQGMCNSIRAFADHILAAFFKACGKEDVGFKERAAWLSDHGSEGAEAYVTQQPVMITLFGVEKIVDKRQFSVIRALRRASSVVSSSSSHSATPIEVAVALEKEGSSVFARDFRAVCSLFQLFFDVTVKKMVQDWKEGQLDEVFWKKFKPDRPHQSSVP